MQGYQGASGALSCGNCRPAVRRVVRVHLQLLFRELPCLGSPDRPVVEHPRLLRIEASLVGTIYGPVWGGSRIVHGGELLARAHKLVEAIIVNPGVPPVFYFVALVGDEDDATVLVLARQLIVSGQALRCQHGFREGLNFVVPRSVVDLQRRSLRLTAKRDRLDLYEIGLAQCDQSRVVCCIGHVVTLHQGEAINSALPLLPQSPQGSQVSLPEVCKQGPIHGLQGLWRPGIHTHVELSDGNQRIDRLRELGIRHQEGADLASVQVREKLIDARIHDRLPDQREGAMLHGHGCLISVLLHTRNPFALADHLPMLLDALGNYHVGIVHPPLPGSAHWILVVPPAEDALVCTGQ
mmetsp:Transcript_14630/g.32045  ORF Transcript_14630/g.32045 Transcript_14630/m.32045 type:complete len:352 (+) Transcript_14630:81-1136(+)